MPYFVSLLQEGNLLHVSLAGNLVEFAHPEIDWLAVLLFDRRKVRGWACDFFIHGEKSRRFSASCKQGFHQVTSRDWPLSSDKLLR
jgi:hypothetical protein